MGSANESFVLRWNDFQAHNSIEKLSHELRLKKWLDIPLMILKFVINYPYLKLICTGNLKQKV